MDGPPSEAKSSSKLWMNDSAPTNSTVSMLTVTLDFEPVRWLK